VNYQRRRRRRRSDDEKMLNLIIKNKSQCYVHAKICQKSSSSARVNVKNNNNNKLQKHILRIYYFLR
jgi:hypothetical protein